MMWQFPEKFRFYWNSFENLCSTLPDIPRASAALHLVTMVRKATRLLSQLIWATV